jgi:hypothetical protein
VPSKDQFSCCNLEDVMPTLPPHGREVVRAEIEHLRRENDRLRKQVDELSIHVEKWVKRALGGTPEPRADADDAQRWRTYLKCYDREEMVAAEWDGPAAITAFIDSMRAAQPPGAAP